MIPAVVCTDNDNNCEIYVNFTFSLVENLSKMHQVRFQDNGRIKQDKGCHKNRPLTTHLQLLAMFQLLT